MAGYGFGAKVKLTVDRSRKAEFNKQISDMVGQIKVSNKFTVLQKDMNRVRREAQAMLNNNPLTLKVNKIDCSAAVNDVKRQLQTMLSALSVTNGVNITGLKDFLGTEGIDATLRQTADAATEVINRMNEAKASAAAFAGQMKILGDIEKSLSGTYRSALSGKDMIANGNDLKEITEMLNKWQQKFEEFRTAQTPHTEQNIKALQDEAIAIRDIITELQRQQVETKKASATIDEFRQNAVSSANSVAKARANSLADIEKKLDTIYQGAISGKSMIQNKDSFSAISALYDDLKQKIVDMTNQSGRYSKKRLNDLQEEVFALQRIIAEQQKVEMAASSATGEYAGQLKVLDNISKSLATTFQNGLSGRGIISDEAVIKKITSDYNEWAQKVEDVKKAVKEGHSVNIEGLQAEGQAIQRNITALQNKQIEEKKAQAAAEKASKAAEAAAMKAAAENEDEIASLKQVASLQERMTKFLKSNSRVSVSEYGPQIRSMLMEMNSGATITTKRLREMEGAFANIRSQAVQTGAVGRTIFDSLRRAYEKFGGWMLITRSLAAAIHTIKNMIASVREIDGAVTQLKIVTGATDEQLTAFLQNATGLAKNLGQSIKDVLGSIETFSRLGYNLADASELAEYATILSNVAAVDTASATTGLTSIIKGYNMNVSEAEHVADVLVQVGQKYAVSASEMMEAYEKSGAALNAANTSFEKSAGLIAAANASVQNSSTVGTALKTISARIRGATADLDALGEDTQDLAQGFSKYAKEIKALTGFDITVDGSTDTYKDIYDIFEGISKVWKDLSDTQQARVAEILGGTRQLQVISSILGNWKDAAGAYSDAMASAGTATQANATYIDSINGKIGVFNATFQELSNNIFSSGLIEFFIELGTEILSELNALEKIHLLLPAIVSIVVDIAGIRAGLAAMHSVVATVEAESAVNTLVASMISEKKATDALAVSVANLTIAEKAKVATKIQDAVASGALEAEEAQQILTTLGLATAEGTLTVANQTLGASFKALMDSIPVWGLIALGVSVLITAVTILSGVFKSNEERLAELNEEYDSLYSTIKNVSSEFKSLKTSADEVIPRFAELARGVNKFGENVSLTDEEYAEFLELNNRVAEMFPELNLGMDENGNYMLALSYGADTLTESLYGLLEAQRLVAAQQLADTLPDLVDNVKAQEKVYDKEKKALQDRLDYYQEAYDAYSEMFSDEVIGNYKEDYGNNWESEFNNDLNMMGTSWATYIQEAFDVSNNTDSWQRILDKFSNDNGLIDWWGVLNSDEFKNVLAGIERELDNVENKVQAKWNTINPAINAWLQTNYVYNDMDEQMQTIARAMVNGLDFSELGLTTAESIENYITDYIINPLYNSGKDVREAFSSITDWQDKLKAEEITFDEFSKHIKDIFYKLISSMSDEDAEAFIENFVAGLHTIDDDVDDFDDAINSVIKNWGAVTNAVPGAESAAAIGDLAEEITDLKKAYDLLQTAQKEMASGSGLSTDTIEKLAKENENYLDYLYEENGVIKLNTEAWKENVNFKMKEDITNLRNEIASLEAENAVLQENIDLYNERAYDTMNEAEMRHYFGLVNEATQELNKNNAAIAEHQGRLALYSALYGSITGDLNAYMAALRNFSNIASTIDSVSDSFQTLADLQAKVADGFTMSLNEALEFARVYPEILNNAQVSADGQIILNENIVNSFLKGKKAELDAQIDSEIAKLEADKAVLEAKTEMAQAQLDIAKNVGDGEGQISKEFAEYRIRASNEMVQALIDNGTDEAEAFKRVAQAMSLNTEEFDRVVKEVCTNVDSNLNNAAYNAAMGVYKNVERMKEDIISVTKQAHEASKAVEGIGKGIVQGATRLFAGSVGGINLKGIDTNVTSGEFNGFDYDFDFKGASLEDFASQVELDISAYQNAISQIDGQIAALQALKNAPLENFKSSGTGGNGSSSGTKDIEEYIASVDDYREALERLERVQEKKDNLELRLSNAKSLEEELALRNELLDTYQQEQNALHTLNDLRDQTISENVGKLRGMGFEIEYDHDQNHLFIKNLEHINELVANGKGKYESVQEATNAYRKEVEELVNETEELNKANKDGSSSWWNLYYNKRDKIVEQYQSRINDRDNKITLTQNWLDNSAANHELNNVERYTDELIAHYKAKQQEMHDLAEYYRSKGYSDTSDEITELSDGWWECESNIRAAKQQMVDYLMDIVSATSSAVDGLQNVYQTLLDAADEYEKSGGFISIDAYQSILDLGPQYMQYLRDENGLLVINEERIQAAIAAKTRQLALDNAMTYVERLKLALQKDSIEDLDELLFATEEASGATWDLVYANLALLGLDDDQYKAALHNINAIRSLADTAVDSIGKTVGSAEDGFDSILKYVMDMLKQQVQDEIDALNEMKEAYGEIIEQRKAALDAAKKEDTYTKNKASKLKEIAKLQAKIDALSLDNSREAQAEKAKLQEEMAELQEELSDIQSDYAIENQKNALDEMKDAYDDEKDGEIKTLEDSISSQQKLYENAIDYIKSYWNTSWDSLKTELLQWNYDVGNNLETEITSAWDNCTRYIENHPLGIDGILVGQNSGNSSSTSTGTSKNTAVGKSNEYDNEAEIIRIVTKMKKNSADWRNADKETQAKLSAENRGLAVQIEELLKEAGKIKDDEHLTIGKDGWWYLPDGRKLYDVYGGKYHHGGTVGAIPTPKQNEIFATLERGEIVLDKQKQDNLYRIINLLTVASDRMGAIFGSSGLPDIIGSAYNKLGTAPNNIVNNNKEAIHFGDVYIYGGNEETVTKHQEVTRRFTNEVLQHLGIRR